MLLGCSDVQENDAAGALPTEDWGTDDDSDLNEDGGAAAEPPTAELPEEPVDPAACVRTTYKVQHLQASMEHFDGQADLRTSIDVAYAAGAQSISWTEVETAVQVQHINARAGWATFWPSGKPEVAANNAVPVSWRTDTFKLIKGKSWFASAGMAHVSPSRWVTRVWLTHLASGKVVSRVAHHSVSGVDGAGKAPVAWRRAAHAQDIAKFKEVMLLDNVPVIGSADFNTTRLRTLLGATAFHYDVPKSGGSHGARLIDWIVRRPHADQKLVDAQFVSLAPSDHRGIRVSYDYAPCK
jgi:hypothetical protein